MLKKKLDVLQEKEKTLMDLEVDFEELEKKVEHILVSQIEKNPEIQSNKCEECGFDAENEHVLKVHRKAKHTEPEKFKCFKCDFSAPTKSELTDHNDVYWDSHRMCLNPRRKKEYLKDFQQMKIDGFTVKESIYNEVMKWDDQMTILFFVIFQFKEKSLDKNYVFFWTYPCDDLLQKFNKI